MALNFQLIGGSLTLNATQQWEPTNTAHDPNPPIPLEDAPAGSQIITPTGIASLEAIGTPTIIQGTQFVTPTGISSLESVGTPTLSVTITVTPTGISSQESVGTPTLIQPSNQTITCTGIASRASVGIPTIVLTPPPVVVYCKECYIGECVGTAGPAESPTRAGIAGAGGGLRGIGTGGCVPESRPIGTAGVRFC